MANSSKLKPKEMEFADSDMAAAAQQLMQLSGDEDDHKNKGKSTFNFNTSKKIAAIDKGLMSPSEMGSRKVFKEDVDQSFKVKKRKYRSIDHLYMATKPLNFLHCKKIRS